MLCHCAAHVKIYERRWIQPLQSHPRTQKHVWLRSRNRVLTVSTSANWASKPNGFKSEYHITKNRHSKTKPTNFSSAYCLRFHRLNWLSRKTETETSGKSHSFEHGTKYQYIKHGAECFLGALLPDILPSLVGFGAPLPHAQHVWEFNIFCEILAHQKISSNQKDKKTPPKPHSIACVCPNAAHPILASQYMHAWE